MFLCRMTCVCVMAHVLCTKIYEFLSNLSTFGVVEVTKARVATNGPTVRFLSAMICRYSNNNSCIILVSKHQYRINIHITDTCLDVCLSEMTLK